jgi:hypothetical protein
MTAQNEHPATTDLPSPSDDAAGGSRSERLALGVEEAGALLGISTASFTTSWPGVNSPPPAWTGVWSSPSLEGDTRSFGRTTKLGAVISTSFPNCSRFDMTPAEVIEHLADAEVSLDRAARGADLPHFCQHDGRSLSEIGTHSGA